MADNKGILAAAAVAGAGLAILALGKKGSNPPPSGDAPVIKSLNIPSTIPGGMFWPTATLLLPDAQAYRVEFVVDPQSYQQPGVVTIMSYAFAKVVQDPTGPGMVVTPLNRSDATYSLRGRGYIAEGTYTYDQALYNAMIAAGQAKQAAYQASQTAWANVSAIEAQIMASWPAGWQDDPNWLYTHPFYIYPEWQAAHDAAQAATDAWYAAADAEQQAIDAFQATEVRTYTRVSIPAQATISGLTSYLLPPGNYPVIGSIFQTLDGVESQFDFGQIGTLKVT